jgi:hypothetical protein
VSYYTTSFNELIVPFKICFVNSCAVFSFLCCKLEIRLSGKIYLARKHFKQQSALLCVLDASQLMVITVFMCLRLFCFLIYYCIYSEWTLPFENKPTMLLWFKESIFLFLVYYSKWYQPFGTEPTILLWFKESIFRSGLFIHNDLHHSQLNLQFCSGSRNTIFFLFE